jgi:hypothetical protein
MNFQRLIIARHIKVVHSCHTNRWLSSEPAIRTRTKSHSGLQKQVLSLYRQLLRTCRAKDVSTQTSVDPFMHALKDSSTSICAIRAKFRKQAGDVRRMDIDRLVYFVDRGSIVISCLNCF